MSKTQKEPGNSKTLAQGNAGIEGEFLGPIKTSLPLIDGENAADYEFLREGYLRAIKPTDALEVNWLQDAVDNSWEAQRLKKIKAALIQASKRDAVEYLIRNLAHENPAKIAGPMSREWSRGEPETVEFVEALLEEHGLSHASVMAKAVELCLPTLESLDKSIALYDHRHDVAIQLLEKRRDLLAKRAREFSEALITDVEPEKLKAGVRPAPLEAYP